MKIKCPLCDGEFGEELVNHLVAGHFEDEVAEYLYKLLFKIHEKIESLENIQCMEGEMPLNDANIMMIKELKSLLDNEK